jgi:hypothetical protein
MRRYHSHDLEMGGYESLDHHAKSYLAIVDLESYPSFVNAKADHLDVLSHLCGQLESLNAVLWETPTGTLRLKLLLTEDAQLSHELLRTHRLVFDGCVRTTSGQLCLTDDERLLAAARQDDRDLLHGKAAPEARSPHILNVPPGVINVGVFCERSRGDLSPELRRDKFDYTVLMRRYPFPPPRVAPVRLTGGLIPWAGAEASRHPWGDDIAPKASPA